MTNWQNQVLEFHQRFGCPIGETPGFRDEDFRDELIREERMEIMYAIADRNFPDAVDGLVDLIYVCLGAAVAWGVDLEPLFQAVHAANMRKSLDVKRSDGKIQKGPDWVAPDIEGLLREQGWQEEAQRSPVDE